MKLSKHIFSAFLIFLLLFQTGVVYGAGQFYNSYRAPVSGDTEIDNLTPFIDYNFTKKAKVDLVFVIGGGLCSDAILTSKINSVLLPITNIKNIDAKVQVQTSVAELNSILPTVEWRDSSTRYYIALSNSTLTELAATDKYSTVIKNLSANEINFIGMGNYINKVALEGLIKNNASRGLFIDNSNLDSALTRLGNYIVGNLSVDLYFNIGKTSLSSEELKAKVDTIIKPKLVANNISSNVVLNDGTYESLAGAVIVTSEDGAGVALKPDKTVWDIDFKYNYSSFSSTVKQVSGVNGIGYLENKVDIAVTASTRYALDASGNVYAWGDNIRGGLGIGVNNSWDNSMTTQPTATTLESSSTPVRVYGLTNVAMIESDGWSTYALKNDGTLWYWGGWTNDQYRTVFNTPRQVDYNYYDFTGDNKIVNITAAYGALLAITARGTAYLLHASLEFPNTGSGYSSGYSPDIYDNYEGFIKPPYTFRYLDSNVVSVNSNCNARIAYMKSDGTMWQFGNVYHPRTSSNAYQFYLLPKKVNGDFSFKQYFTTYAGVFCFRNNGVFDVVDSVFTRENLNYFYPHGIGRSDIYSISTPAQNVMSQMVDYRYRMNYILNDGTTFFEYSEANYTDPWDNRANRYDINNLNMKSKFANPLDSELSKASFHETADQYFINLSDSKMDELSSSVALNSITNTFNNSNMRFIGIGNGNNQAALQNVINLNNSKGQFYDISNIDATLNQLADYIVSNAMRPSTLNSNYMLVSDDIEAPEVFYRDIESDLYDSKWIYEHNTTNFFNNSGATVPFDNSNGAFTLDRKILSAPVTSFIETDSSGSKIGKVGGYKVKLQVRDKPKGDNAAFDNYRRDSNTVTRYINIHRKPVAKFNCNITDMPNAYNVELIDSGMSYDIDHTSRADKGISKRIWGYAKIAADGSVNWQYTKTTDNRITYTLPKGCGYLVSLQVQDIDGPYGYGAWSDPFIVGIPGKPVAQFTISPNPLPVSTTASVADTSYVTVPGTSITQRQWNITKVGNPYFSYVNQPTCKSYYGDSGVGEYVITLRVMDNAGTWSDPYTQRLLVVDNAAPTISASPASRTWGNSDVGVNLSATDSGGSGLKRLDYIWTKDANDISLFTSVNINSSPVSNYHNVYTTQSVNGKWYLCGRALDHSGNFSNSGQFNVFGLYCIDKINPSVYSTFAPGEYETPITTSIVSSDTGGSGVKTVFYKWTNSTEKPTSGWAAANVPTAEVNNYSFNITQNIEGDWYLHMLVSDYAGNTYYTYSGKYIYCTNKPPTVKITGTVPGFIYEGDNTSAIIQANDPDGDTLKAHLVLLKNGTQIFSEDFNIVPSGAIYNPVTRLVKNSIEKGNYKIRVTVSDKKDVTAADEYDFSVNELSLTGSVAHTDLWNEHRIDYNKAKNGDANSPRAYSDFFPGEKFMLKALTSVIDPSRPDLRASSVTCSLIGTSFNDNMSNTSGINWTGSIWDKSMETWNTRELTFRFIVTYVRAYGSNTVITKDVKVNILDDEYWRLHMKF